MMIIIIKLIMILLIKLMINEFNYFSIQIQKYKNLY